MWNKEKVALVLTGLLLILALGSIFGYQHKAIRTTKNAIEYNTYDKHYALIASEGDEELWDKVYESALEEGKSKGVYVERFGSDLAVKYSKTDLFRLAMEASVDGIIVEGDETQEMSELIEKAVNDGIPVITVLSDCSNSKRQSYVGINSYSIGQEYAKHIIKDQGEELEKALEVLVVVNYENEDSGQNRMLLGIRESLIDTYGSDNVKVSSVCIDAEDNFAMEEYMRALFLDKDKELDYLLCLDAVSTTQAYAASVNFNAVGKTHILGYYDSEGILSALSKNLLDMTISLDTAQMGKDCVDVLMDYEDTGYTNGYITVDFRVIDPAEAAALIKQEAKDE